MKHVAINCIFLVPGETGGMEVAARALLPALRDAAPGTRFTALVNVEAAGEDLGADQVVLRVRARHRPSWVLGDQLLVPRMAGRLGCDLVHSPGGVGPTRTGMAHVVTIHDLHYRTQPHAHFGVRGLGMRALVPLVAHGATRVITASHHARDQLERHLRLRPDKIDVVPHGVAAPGPRSGGTPMELLRSRLDLDDRPLLLVLSAPRPHKNLANLLEALVRIDQAGRPLTVLTGYSTPHERELRHRVGELGLGRDIRFTGWLPDADVDSLLAMATLLVHPALEEGFGLPVLEAMAHGVPVACSDRPPLTEVADGCATLFDPTDAEDITRAIELILRDRRRAAQLAAAGRARAARFSWSATATQTLVSYERALSTRRDGQR